MDILRKIISAAPAPNDRRTERTSKREAVTGGLQAARRALLFPFPYSELTSFAYEMEVLFNFYGLYVGSTP